MILVLGGYAQGKLDYVKGNFGSDSLIVDNLNDLARVFFDQGETFQQAGERILAMEETGRNLILISNEIGCGIVPIEKDQRSFREWMGRLQTMLAKNADEVIRVVCGIGQRIK